ncbi:UDP-N-acetylmuramoyl-L-alanyl-D-glutamate--2,6-diaminopimelate ligase [Eionea flava]
MALYKDKADVFTLGQLLPHALLDYLPGQLAHVAIHGLSINSRAINKGDVFVAVQGVSVHGQQYIADAVSRGALAILCDMPIESNSHSVPVITIPNLQNYLSEIAGNFYFHPTRYVPVVGITGTNGKTSCAQMYAQLAALFGETAGVIGTTGVGVCALQTNQQYRTSLALSSTGMTTPDAISVQRLCSELMAPSTCASSNDLPITRLVMEVSSHGLSQYRVAALDINTAIFTNLTHDHLDYHGDMAAYGEAKSRLFCMSSVEHAIINVDDEFGVELIKQIAPSVRVTQYSIHNANADIYLSNVRHANSQTLANVHTKEGVYSLSTPFVGEFNLSNLLAVLSIFDEAGQLEKAISLVPYLMSIDGRMESLENKLGLQIVVDFAHTPDALQNALQAINEQVNGDVYCVFGCGGDRDADKRPLMAAIAERYAQHVIVTNDNPRTENPESIVADITQGFSRSGHRVIMDREQAICLAVEEAKSGDAILIAGKGHESYQIIGQEKLHFSDQLVAQNAIHQRECRL